MRRSVPVKLKLYLPTTPEGNQALMRRAAGVHADFVSAQIKSLSCPTKQKLALVDAVIAAKRAADGQ